VDSLQLATQPQQHAHQPQLTHQPQGPPGRSGSSGSQAAEEAAGSNAASPSVPSSDEQQQRHEAQARAEAARLAADNAALRCRLAKTHRLIGAMQVTALPRPLSGTWHMPYNAQTCSHGAVDSARTDPVCGSPALSSNLDERWDPACLTTCASGRAGASPQRHPAAPHGVWGTGGRPATGAAQAAARYAAAAVSASQQRRPA
jgi:hypothetical protein